jgi:hypothetical protein
MPPFADIRQNEGAWLLLPQILPDHDVQFAHICLRHTLIALQHSMTVPKTKIKAVQAEAQPNAACNGLPCPGVLRFCAQRLADPGRTFPEWLKSAFCHNVLSRKSNTTDNDAQR